MADVGISDLFEDGVGFGAKTMSSIKDVTLFPRRYFLAAQTKDWSGYSPSIRVYVVLLAVSSYLRYLYIGDGQLMTELYAGQFQLVIDELSKTEPRWAEVDARDLADSVLSNLFFYLPFVSFALYTLFGMVWRAYAEPLPIAVRVRYIYALLIPATLFMLAGTVLMVILPESWAGVVSFGSLLASAVVVSVTAYFGAFPPEESPGGRFGRAFTLGFCLIGVMLLATLLTLSGSTFAAMREAYAATAI
ncbi:MAG: hypothetical protein WBF53_01840 [Litorimonas sp.]